MDLYFHMVMASATSVAVGGVILVIGLFVLIGHKQLAQAFVARSRALGTGTTTPSEGYGRVIVAICGLCLSVAGLLTVTGVLGGN